MSCQAGHVRKFEPACDECFRDAVCRVLLVHDILALFVLTGAIVLIGLCKR